MENNTNPTTPNANSKHSLLSAQADLNTGTVFHNSPIPERPASSITPSQPMVKPLPQSVQDASEDFRRRMEMEKQKSMTSLQSSVGGTSINHAESTKSYTTAQYMGMSNQKPAGQVVFDSDSEHMTTVSGKRNGHAFILTISILILIGLLGAGVYYWYQYMGGKDLIESKINSSVPTQDTPKEPVAVPKQVQTFPAIVKTATTTQAVPKTTVTNQNTFAPVKTTVPTPKKTNVFGDAEKEFVSSYISTNINKLSKIKSSTGFSVEDIRFDGQNRAIVSYGDGDFSISAVVNFTYSNGVVKVSSFSILEK